MLDARGKATALFTGSASKVSTMSMRSGYTEILSSSASFDKPPFQGFFQDHMYDAGLYT